MKKQLKDLTAMTNLSASTSKGQVIKTGDKNEIEFIANSGLQPLIKSSKSIIITRLVQAEAEAEAERQVIACESKSDSVVLGYDGSNVEKQLLHFT
jgi:hypothetical protein